MGTNYLHSGWRLKGYIGEDWRWRDALLALWDGYAYFDDNFIHLLPCEQRTITVIWDGIPPEERAIGLQALNAEERIFHG